MESLFNTNCVMGDLVGKTIEALSMSIDRTILVVSHGEGKSVYQAVADGGARVWITGIVGVSNLIGQTVVSASDIEVERVDDYRVFAEYDESFGIRLTTQAGVVDIVYRVSSDGCEGGDLLRVDASIAPDESELMAIGYDLK